MHRTFLLVRCEPLALFVDDDDQIRLLHPRKLSLRAQRPGLVLHLAKLCAETKILEAQRVQGRIGSNRALGDGGRRLEEHHERLTKVIAGIAEETVEMPYQKGASFLIMDAQARKHRVIDGVLTKEIHHAK